MTIVLRSHAIHQGPNIWHHSPVVHCAVEAASTPYVFFDPEWLTSEYTRLGQVVHERTSLPPLLVDHDACIGAAIARTALDLQRVAGVPVTFSYGRPRSMDEGFDVVVEFRHAEVGLQAVRLALEWISHVLDPGAQTFDIVNAFARFAIFNETNDGGVMGRALTAAAERRGVPITVVDPRGRYLELGTGRLRKRLSGTLTSSTSAIASAISQDKQLTKRYLRAAGLPVPEGFVAQSLDEALVAARSLGYPVAVKPINLGDSIGVFLDLRSDDDVRSRFDQAASASISRKGVVLVERFMSGNDYRALVVNDEVVALTRRLYPQVTGDGVHSIGELIEIENANPRRGTVPSIVYRQIAVDERLLANLAQKGLSLDDVPPLGDEIVLKQSGHRRDGAIQVNVIDSLHPVNAAMLRMATRVLGLDVAGIDLITPDIAQPIWEVGGAIIEINHTPAFNLHLFPGVGPAGDPGSSIMDMLYPPGTPVRVPVAAVAACAESSSLCQGIACALRDVGTTVGLATRDGLVIDGVAHPDVPARNPAGPRTLLNNPMVDAAVIEIDAASIVEQGLGFDRCDVAVVRSLSGLETPFGQPVEIVLLRALDPNGVAILDGSDPLVRELAGMVPANLIWIGLDPADPRRSEMLDRGDRLIETRETPRGARYVVVSRDSETVLPSVPLPERGETPQLPPISDRDRQAAAAAAWALASFA